jgi:hypothetical protein
MRMASGTHASGGIRAQGLQERKGVAIHGVTPAHHEADGDAQQHGEEKGRVGAVDAVEDVLVVHGREERDAKAGARLNHSRNTVSGGVILSKSGRRNTAGREVPREHDDHETQEGEPRVPAQDEAGDRPAGGYFCVPFTSPVGRMTPMGSLIPSSLAASSSSFA